MHRTKKFFIFKNKIILTNGASLKILSIKYIKNYQLNLKTLRKNKKTFVNNSFNKNKLNFFRIIF